VAHQVQVIVIQLAGLLLRQPDLANISKQPEHLFIRQPDKLALIFLRENLNLSIKY